MPNHSLVKSPQLYARVGGALYVVVIILGVLAELFVRGKLVVYGDAAATANNIIAHDSLYRFGFAAELIESLCTAFLVLIFYELFKVVSRPVALLVLFFSIIGTTIGVVNLLNHLAPLKLLSGAAYLNVIPIEQLQAQAYLSLRLFEFGFALSLVFFGFFCIFQGYLIYNSGFMPRIIGILLAIQGVCYLSNSFINFLAPSYSGIAFNILAISVVGEVSLSLWLLIKGVDVKKWHAKARILEHA